MMNYFAVDVGATNTRVWLLSGNRVVAKAQYPVGVKNSAISGDSSLLSRSLHDAFHSLGQSACARPIFVLAAGMITSRQGLCEVPHVLAPAGKASLGRRVRRKLFPHIYPYPFFLVPGVRINSAPAKLGSIEGTDIIRGEECVIVGLTTKRRLNRSWLLLHLGSHTKAIEVNGKGQIVSSVTTLSGECLDAIQAQTILSAHFPRNPSVGLRPRFLMKGKKKSMEKGLLRALFMVRLLAENHRYSCSDLYSFLLGAIIGTDLKALKSSGLAPNSSKAVFIDGHRKLQKAWTLVLKTRKCRVLQLEPLVREAAFLDGLRSIVFSSPTFNLFAEKFHIDLESIRHVKVTN